MMTLHGQILKLNICIFSTICSVRTPPKGWYSLLENVILNAISFVVIFLIKTETIRYIID